jgi:hypothetical protein
MADLPSVVSLQALSPGANWVGASHCQEGQGDTLYDVKYVEMDIAMANGAMAKGGKNPRKKTKKTKKNKKTRKVRKTRKI